MADGATLEVHDVGLAFGGLQVLQGVSFATRGSELLCLIGPNGAGKTSVLNCICGIYKPSQGRITFDGHDLTRCRRTASRGSGWRARSSTAS